MAALQNSFPKILHAERRSQHTLPETVHQEVEESRTKTMDLFPKISKITITKTSLKYKWIINDAAYCMDIGGAKSPKFPSDAEEISITGSQWYIGMKVMDVDRKRCLRLMLYGFSKSSAPLRVSCTLAILTENGDVFRSGSSTFSLSAEAQWKYSYCHDFIISDLSQPQLKVLVNDQLTVRCTIEIDDKRRTKSIRYKIPQCNLWQNFETLMITGENADVTLEAEDQQIRAHKAILMARSPVFKAMFGSQMTESVTNLVKIDDIDFAALEELLRFVYTGKAPNLSEMADRLLIAAGKYDLPKLQAMCEEEIGSNLSVENAAQTLAMADLHGAKQLRKHTLCFIKVHANQVFDTEGWQEIVSKYPLLLNAVCRQLAGQQLE